jgi:hypothetical protein
VLTQSTSPHWYPTGWSAGHSPGGFDFDFGDFFSAQLRTGHQAGESNGVGIFQVRVDGSYDDTSLDRDQIDTYEGDAHPGVDHDSFIQHPVEDIDQARPTRNSFDRH